MTNIEAMKLAFERMTGLPDAWTNPMLMQSKNGFIQGWEAAISEAEQAEQEPVAWAELTKDCIAVSDKQFDNAIPLYIAPPQQGIHAEHSREWVEPNAEHLEQVLHEKVMDMRMTNSDFAKAIITLCREANK